jgi:DNA excision repair protein ERCC-2
MEKKLKKNLKISVVELIAYLFPTGSLGYTPAKTSRLLEGAELHRKLQSLGEGASEVALLRTIEMENCTISFHGRADQVYLEDQQTVIREIKSTYVSPEHLNPETMQRDWLQAVAYAFLMLSEKEYSAFIIELCYIHLPGKELSFFRKYYDAVSIEELGLKLLASWLEWKQKAWEWEKHRNHSLELARFPFSSMRKGQEELMDLMKLCISEQTTLWVEAPTGIGKTMATLYPSILSLKNQNQKVFYLCAKTSQQDNVLEAIHFLTSQGIKLRNIQLTAKEKLCLHSSKSCDPLSCPFAEAYYDRLMEALNELLQLENFSSKEACEIAEKHRLCPFEFLLDASLWADIIIGDYNYFYDPRVYLKRYWDNTSYQAVVLVDEAHNLVDRSREMYSSLLSKKELIKGMKNLKRKAPLLFEALKQIQVWFKEQEEDLENLYDDKCLTLKRFPEALEVLLEEAQDAFVKLISQVPKVVLPHSAISLYFEISFMLKLLSLYDDRFFSILSIEQNDVFVKIACINPSAMLKECNQKGCSVVFFSASLSPLSYYKEALGGDRDDPEMVLSSPFPRENLLSMMDASISTRWKNRPQSLKPIKTLIETAISVKKGKYIAYFPSYQYLNDFVAILPENPPYEVMIQKTGMKEREKKQYLSAFEETSDQSLLALAVLGGSFAEGIDLLGEKLHGVIIVGVGLPKICPERELIRNYFQEHLGKGYEFAYLYPGLNKVMQAGGRVIRSEYDRGFILLLEDRFANSSYQKLIPEHWKPLQQIINKDHLKEQLGSFWALSDSL